MTLDANDLMLISICLAGLIVLLPAIIDGAMMIGRRGLSPKSISKGGIYDDL